MIIHLANVCICRESVSNVSLFFLNIIQPHVASNNRTKRITKKLGKICDGQSANVERLVELVKENGEIIKAMKVGNVNKEIVK